MCSNKGDKVVLGDCRIGSSPYLKYCFFQQYLHFERSSNVYSIYLICYILLLWKPNKLDIFMKLTVSGSYLSYYKG